jgi:hypothetical protein
VVKKTSKNIVFIGKGKNLNQKEKKLDRMKKEIVAEVTWKQ